MRIPFSGSSGWCCCCFVSAASAAFAADSSRIAIVIHGGAGVINRAEMTPEREAHIPRGPRSRATPDMRFSKGWRLESRRRDGGGSIAGRQSLCSTLARARYSNRLGIAELDSSIMDGKTLRAGAIAAFNTSGTLSISRAPLRRNPRTFSSLARAPRNSRWSEGFTLVPNSYFAYGSS